MAKKVKTNTGKTYDLVDVAAYIALIFAAIVFFLTMIFTFLKLGMVLTICNLVKDIAIFAALSLGGWSFAKRRKKIWRIFYWIAFVTYAVCMVVGFGGSFI